MSKKSSKKYQKSIDKIKKKNYNLNKLYNLSNIKFESVTFYQKVITYIIKFKIN